MPASRVRMCPSSHCLPLPPTASHWRADGDRPWDRGVRHVVEGDAHQLSSWLVSQGRAGAEDGATACKSPPAGRRPPGGDCRRKLVVLLAKAHQRVRRQRADFQHKTALKLVRESGAVYHEELQVRNMVHNMVRNMVHNMVRNMVRTTTSPRASVMRAGRCFSPS